MPTIEELEAMLSKETTDRILSDNDLKILISNETLKRNQEDAKNKISISNRSVERSDADSSIYQKMYDEIESRNEEISKLEVRMLRLESIINANPEKYKLGKKVNDNKLMISQEMFVRQLNMLKRSAKFIIENAKVEQIAEDKDESVDFLIHLNNMQLTFDNLLANKNKYTLTEETSKCIEEAESLKKKLEELSNNWDIEALFVNRRSREGDCSDKRLKENIVLLGTTDENINVYQFNYIFDPMKVNHVGVIAQELLETEYKNNVYMHEDGFYRVDYKHLDMTFDGQLLPYLAK